jgi:hypothetical protein
MSLPGAGVSLAPGNADLKNAGVIERVVKLTSANMNSTADQAITIPSTLYRVTQITARNASISLTTAAGGIYTSTAKGGTAVVAAAQVYSALTASTKFVDLTLAVTADVLTAGTLYLSLTTAQGAAATADVYVFYQDYA